MKTIKMFLTILIISSLFGCEKRINDNNKVGKQEYSFIEKKTRISSYIDKVNNILKDEELAALEIDVEKIQFKFNLSESEEYLDIQFNKKPYGKIWAIGGYVKFSDIHEKPDILDKELLLYLVNGVSDEKLTAEKIDEYFQAEGSSKSCGCSDLEDEQESSLLVVKNQYNDKGNSFELEIYNDHAEGLVGYFSFFGTIAADTSMDEGIETLESAIKQWELSGIKSYSLDYLVEINKKQRLNIIFDCNVFADNAVLGWDIYHLMYTNELKNEEEAFEEINVDLIDKILTEIGKENVSKEEMLEFLNEKSDMYDVAYTQDTIEKEYNPAYVFEEGYNLLYWLTTYLREGFIIYGRVKDN